jgi:hypothetical protein
MDKADIQKATRELFGPGAAVSVDILTNARSLVLSVYDSVITFAHLQALSKMFNTTKIDLQGKSTGGGCETCDYGNEEYVDIFIYDVKE